MKRYVSLEEISDGRLYGGNDMVKADCHGCKDCHECCTGMGGSVILDPLDMYRLEQGVGEGLEALLVKGKLELGVTGGVVLPGMRMAGEEERCAFLDESGRCSIHPWRPGVCRLFPLGRIYENGDFKYFLQIGECREKGRTKVKVSKWIDTPDQARNHAFICRWHDIISVLEEKVMGAEDLEECKRLNTLLLETFYMDRYETDRDFYEQFDERLARLRTESVFHLEPERPEPERTE